MKKTLERFLPAPIFSGLESGKVAIQLMLMRAGAKFRENDQIFSRIYEANEWGGAEGEFYSGLGAYEQPVENYVNLVREFIVVSKIDSVVDLGCGDFNIGRKIISPGLRYTGVDVVRPLINHNNHLFGSDNVSFQCLDIARDPLPDGTLCMVRQVFQHLSNANIKAVLPKLRKYKFVLVTEHYPSDAEVELPNKDIPTGADIRARWRSGVYLDKPPFNVKNIVPFHEFKSDWTADSLNEPTIVRTFLIRQIERRPNQ